MTSKKKLEGGSGGGSGGSTNYVQPISSSSSSATMKRYGKGAGENSREIFRKGPWTPEEDALLMQYVKRHGERHWNSVQKTGLMRCGKSCRLRWTNHLRPDLKKGSFTPEEERIVLDLHHKLGNKWSKIAAQLPGRTDNEVKNFWNTKIKRKMRARLLYNNTQQQQPEQKTEPLSQQQQQSPNHINPNPSSSSSDHTVNPSTTPDLFSPSNNSNSFLNRIHTVNSTQDPILSFLNNPVYNKYNLFSNADEDFHHQQQNWSDPFQFSSSGISRFRLSPQSSPSANYFNPTPFLTTPSTQFDYGLSVPPTVSNNLFHSDSSKPAPTQGTMKMKMGSDENIFTELPSFQIDPMITMAAVPTTTTNTTANYAMSSPLPNLSNSSGYVYSNERGNDQYRDYTAGMMIGGDRFAFLHHDEGLKEVCRDGIFDGIDQLDHGYSSGSSGVMGNQSFYGSASSPLLSTSEVKLKKDLMEGIETMDDDELRNLLDTFSSFEPSIDWFHHTNATTLTTIGGGGLNMGDAIILENSHHEDDIAGAVTTTAPSSTGLAIAADHHHLQWNEGGCDWSNMPGMR